MKILIVGGTSGIGFSLAKSLSIKDNEVYIGVHKDNQVISTVEKVKIEQLKIKVIKLDVRNDADRKIINKINPDCLVIHDSIGNGGSILEMDINVLRDNYETNIFSNLLLL